ncbi:hypothetical protein AJ78_03910 [Emergomyces pasteurianus Ep9510]|uniref:PBSP domain-containing protein n=1 Tax=Emergomyces pasteurianus Ep9510 TaxID=1447872 RepID=A0A1J9PHE5_9EURO|nr:hypothetical protein AJ78_03910 [Emergomyces pasteurianus Ep9510]
MRTMYTPSSSPVQLTPNFSPIPDNRTNKTAKNADAEDESTVPHGRTPHSPPQPTPKLRLHLQDLTHPATKAFINLIADPNAAVNTALANIVTYLYTSPPERHQPGGKSGSFGSNAHHIYPHFSPSLPGTRSITFIIRDISGIAYTTGTDLDPDHKEIHISLPYISRVSSTFADATRELLGVITHELVHCYQHTHPHSHPQEDEGDEQLQQQHQRKRKQKKGKPKRAVSSPPSGLVEGIADFVRLKAGLVPPHWKRPTGKAERGEKWDQGYQATAFFLEWIEDVKIGKGAVGMLNDRLLRVGYVNESDEDCSDGDGDDGSDGDGEKRERGVAVVMKDSEDPAECGFWRGLFGAGVLELWEEYGVYLDSLK